MAFEETILCLFHIQVFCLGGLSLGWLNCLLGLNIWFTEKSVVKGLVVIMSSLDTACIYM